MKRNFVLIVLLLSPFLVVSPNIHAQTTNSTCVSKYTEIISKLNSIQVPDQTFTCTRKGTINDEYWNACAESYYNITAVTQLIGINCENANQQALLDKELKDTYIKRAKEQLDYYFGLSTTNVLTPRPTISQEDFLAQYKDNVDKLVAGGINAPCVAGNVELIADDQPIPGFLSDIVSLLDKLVDTAISLAQDAFDLVGIARTSNTPTDFCPIDKDIAIPVFYKNGNPIIITKEEYLAASGKSEDSLFELVKSGTISSDVKRIFESYRMLKNTANMSYDEKAQALEYIQETLGSKSGTPLTCMCKDKVKYAQQLRDQGVLGVSDDIYSSKNEIAKPSVLGIMVGEVDYKFIHIDGIEDFSNIIEIGKGIVDVVTETAAAVMENDENINSNPLRGNYKLRADYCASLSTDEKIKRFTREEDCYQKLGDTYLSAKQVCSPLLSLENHEDEHLKCLQCSWLDSGAWTAIGCIHSDFSKTVERLFTIALGFGGLAALGCIIYASFIMQTSAGNPEKTKKAQELITSCIAGLILIIFSVFILRVLGVDILRIPGFN